MKRMSEKLLSLLGLCADNENEATKLQMLARITQSADYQELSKSIALKKPFEENYSLSALESLDNSGLKKREELLHKIVYLQRQLVRCINYGNGPEITSKDSPDFTSLKSVKRLLSKISLAQEKTNYSNIKSDNVLALFSDATVKSARDCFNMLPISLTKTEKITEADITKNMGDTLYCIDIAEFDSIHREFLRFSEKGEKVIAAEKIRRKKHRLLKTAVVMLSFGAVFICAQFGLLAESYTITLNIAVFLATILYLIWG